MIAGFDGAEDAGVFRIAPDRALVLTNDFFPPMIDDPFAFGRVAAANALSDVFAMGGRPLAALNIVGFPKDLGPEVLAEMLAGGAEAVRESHAAIVGGHSIASSEVLYGLAVTGEVHPERVLRNNGAAPGDVLLLTKPLGSGLITSSIKARANEGPEVTEALRWMGTLNGLGLEAILQAPVHAMTDVTGFGLVGHLQEMVANDPLHAVIESAALPRIPGVENCFEPNNRTRGARENRELVADRMQTPSDLDEWTLELLSDPQTSGGLLIAVAEDGADRLLSELRDASLELAAIIGRMEEASAPGIRVV